MLGDRRHLLCQSLWNGGLSSREKNSFLGCWVCWHQQMSAYRARQLQNAVGWWQLFLHQFIGCGSPTCDAKHFRSHLLSRLNILLPNFKTATEACVWLECLSLQTTVPRNPHQAMGRRKLFGLCWAHLAHGNCRSSLLCTPGSTVTPQASKSQLSRQEVLNQDLNN